MVFLFLIYCQSYPTSNYLGCYLSSNGLKTEKRKRKDQYSCERYCWVFLLIPVVCIIFYKLDIKYLYFLPYFSEWPVMASHIYILSLLGDLSEAFMGLTDL